MKFIMLKDLDGDDIAVNPLKVHTLQIAVVKKGPATYINFGGEDFVRVLGTVEETANEFRLQQE
jgi:hypothetical protein